MVEAVESAESRTSAEFVVSLQPYSGRYRDLDLLFASGITLLSLFFIVFNPWLTHSVVFLPIDVVVTFGLAWLFSSHLPFVRRLLASSDRKQSQVLEVAQLMFHREGIAQTRARTGVMVLVSQMERRIEVVADSGVTRMIDNEAWDNLVADLQPLALGEDLAEAAAVTVDRLGDFLSGPLPVADDDIDELTNEPRSNL